LAALVRNATPLCAKRYNAVDAPVNILVIDIGGTSVKLWKTGETDVMKFRSGKKLTPDRLLRKVTKATADWSFDRVSIGYPAATSNGEPIEEPMNLGEGWVGFDFSSVFGCPVRIMNDASMQALGSYDGGRMLYLGFGTGVGSALIVEGVILSLALGLLPIRKGKTLNHFLSSEGFAAYGVKRWRKMVAEASAVLKAALMADYVVLGGGNVKRLKELPEGCRRGGNQNAYFGGLRMWEDIATPVSASDSYVAHRVRES
jgi:polyphosphate glucokinase